MVSVHDYTYYKLRKLDPLVWFTFIRCVKLFLQLFDVFVQLLGGSSILKGSKKEQKEAGRYEKSAHVLKVVSRGAIMYDVNHDETNFLYLHHSYVHPNYILKHENAILLTVKNDRAIFCVSDKDVSAYSSKTGPFVNPNLFISATKLIVLPIEHFHRLAKDRGDPFEKDDIRITIIHMTGRCGSTIIGTL